jgi:hypothetical protein
MAATPKHPPGQPMTLANMRAQGVHHLIAFCLNDACRHQALIDVSSYPSDTPVPWFRSKVKCGKCGGRKVDVGPNWKERRECPRLARAAASVAARLQDSGFRPVVRRAAPGLVL